MRINKLGSSGLEVSAVALGCWGFAGGSMWGDTEERESIQTIHAALDSGINFLDTAEAYGDGLSEEIVGKALRGRRDQAILASKVSAGHYEPSTLRACCEASLSRLGTDTMDLYQLHWPNRSDTPMADVIGELEKLKSEGKIRHWGVCNFGVYELSELPKAQTCVSNQLGYSILFRAIEFEILPKSREMGLGVLVYSGLLHGILSGKYHSADEVPEGRARTRHFSSSRPGPRHEEPGQERLTFDTLARIREIADQAGLTPAQAALGWLLEQPGITTILAGARTPDQARRNAQTGDLKLSADVVRALTEATEELKEALGPNPDMWDVPGRIRWTGDGR